MDTKHVVVAIAVVLGVVVLLVRDYVRGTLRFSRVRPRRAVAAAELFERATRTERSADLVLPSGEIVACDPLTLFQPSPFIRRVAPGCYRTETAIVELGPGDERVAALRIAFRDGVAPVTWEPAETSSPDGLVGHGYGVDAGVGCFMDALVRDQLLNAAREVTTEDDDALLRAVLDELGERSWLSYRPDPQRDDNVVIVHSGWGDGIYFSTWGLDAEGIPVCLVTDFQVISDPA
ncbi:MAG: DUF4241 domain-containing protein [Kofleriaceae bacterium]